MLTLEKIQKSNNIAKLLTNEELAKIANEVIQGYDIDEDSRITWKGQMKEAMDMAMLLMEDQVDTPWEGAANVKYPLIASAANDYSSRTCPELLKGGNTFMGPKVIGKDPNNKKYNAGKRVCDYMSYYLNYMSPDWVEGTEKLLQLVSVVGTVFKKTYYNEIEERICSDLCSPFNIVVNANIKSLKTAPRITNIIKFYMNDIIERQRAGMYRDKDNDGRDLNVFLQGMEEITGEEQDFEAIATQDQNKQLAILEQCCYLDLDGDGYSEPYIVTLHKSSRVILRIISNFKEVKLTKEKKVKRIVPEQYYTDFHFMKSSNGCYYSVGFGMLLPLNHTINSVFNMLLNAGTLCTTPGGIIGSGIRPKNGKIEFKLGRYQHVATAPGEDIAKNIYPWPCKEPSQTLFQMLGLLIQTGKELASTVDVLSGNNSAQNVASSTVSQIVEQGTKAFIAINNRIHRSFSHEFMKIYYLTSKHKPSQQEYIDVLDDPEANVQTDFAVENLNIVPVADPNLSSESQRIYKATLVMQNPIVDRKEATRYYLQAMQVDDDIIAKLLPEQQPPSPEEQKTTAEIQAIQANIANLSAQATLNAQEMQLKFAKLQTENKKNEAMVGYYQALVWQILDNARHNMVKDETTKTKMEAQETIRAADLARKERMDSHDMQMDHHSHKMDEITTAFDIFNAKQEKKKEENKDG